MLGEEKDNIGKTRSKTDKPSPKKSPRLKKVSTMQSTTQVYCSYTVQKRPSTVNLTALQVAILVI